MPQPLVGEAALRANFTNEGGVGGTTRFLKNIMGLWLVQECRRAWERAGSTYSYDDLMRQADTAPAFASLVNPNDPSFILPPNMPAALADFCRRSGQPAPDGVGGTVRCALESLALWYRWVLERLELLTGSRAEVIHIVGGGCQNALLNQFTADACNRPVLAGPIEATAIGNVLVQALAAGGDRAVALAEFDAFRQRLASEAGLDPSPAAQELRQRVLLSRPRPEPAGIAAAARPQGTFAGRGPECAQIAATAAGSGPRLLLVTGPPGVGKSRLLAEAAQAARVPVLSAQAVPGDRDDAWALAGRLLRQAADLAHAAGIGLAEAGALADITAPQALAFMPAAAAAERRALATRAAVRLAEAVAQPRCLIVADDLHWADRESLGLLGLLLRRTDRISIVGSCRPDAAGPGWSAAAALGVPATEAAHIALGPLLPEAFRRLLADPVLAEAILDQACRTPFAATEIVAALARDGTLHWDDDGLGRLQSPAGPERAHAVAAAGIAGALDSRLVGLPAGQRQLVCLLAALGRPAPAALLADACGTDSRDVLTLLEALARAGMTRDGPRGCGLRGEALGRAVAGTLGPAEKAYAHGLLARALQRAGADPAEVAAHLAGSGDRDAAALAYAAAARSQLA
ncbi:MAG: FGGY-family carbohydrate kinase, partial [Streptosporangiaceae bacterium]